MYCVKCGVELEKDVEKCPLCRISVPKLERLEYDEVGYYESEYPKININLYDLKIKKVKKAIFIAFFTISIISILEIFFQNIIIYGSLKWGYYAIPSIMIFDLFLYIILNSHNLRINLIFLLTGMITFLIILDYGDKNFSWSIKRGIPIVVAFCFLGIIFSFVWDRHKEDRIKVMNFLLFFIGIFLLVLEFIISRTLTWSIWSSIPLFVLNVMLRYVYKSYKEEFKRRLHR